MLSELDPVTASHRSLQDSIQRLYTVLITEIAIIIIIIIIIIMMMKRFICKEEWVKRENVILQNAD